MQKHDYLKDNKPHSQMRPRFNSLIQGLGDRKAAKISAHDWILV